MDCRPISYVQILLKVLFFILILFEIFYFIVVRLGNCEWFLNKDPSLDAVSYVYFSKGKLRGLFFEVLKRFIFFGFALTVFGKLRGYDN